MAKREFLMLAHTLKSFVPGWFCSEKLDGQRCFWDGGISRGIPCSDVPWANIVKDARYIEPPIATGLWTRYGKSIQAPDWWINELPLMPLDGELSCGRGSYQLTRTIVSRLDKTGDWEKVRFACFDIPPLQIVFSAGELRWRNLDGGIISWCHRIKPDCSLGVVPITRYREVYESLIFKSKVAYRLEQTLVKSVDDFDKILEGILDSGGEGVILRNPESIYVTQRSHNLLKKKPWLDDEATVIGYVSGREGKEGRLLGLMGAMIVSWKGKQFELSGFSMDERVLMVRESKEHGNRGISMHLDEAREWCEQHPGQQVPAWIENGRFPRNSIVTFRYRELTNDGIPKEARFYRSYEGV